MQKQKGLGLRNRDTASEIIEKNGFANYPVQWETVKEIVKDDLQSSNKDKEDIEDILNSDIRIVHYVHYHWGYVNA